MKINFKFHRKRMLSYFYIALILINAAAVYYAYNFASKNILPALSSDSEIFSSFVYARLDDVDLNRFELVISNIEKKTIDRRISDARNIF